MCDRQRGELTELIRVVGDPLHGETLPTGIDQRDAVVPAQIGGGPAGSGCGETAFTPA
jgi:hypothetical protein